MWRSWRVRRPKGALAATTAGAAEQGQRQHRHTRTAVATDSDIGKGHGDRHYRHRYGRRWQNVVRKSSRFMVIRRREVSFGLAALVFFVILLILVNIIYNRRIGEELRWSRSYMRAVVENQQQWHLGWRLEDLARQISSQRARMAVLLETLHSLALQGYSSVVVGGGGSGGFSAARAAAAAAAARAGEGGGEEGDERKRGKSGVTWRGKLSRETVLSKVLTEEEDLNRVVSVQCATRPGLFVQVGMHAMEASAESSCKVYSAASALGPHTLFEKIELGEGCFALRAFSNKRFLRVTPPTEEEGEWTTWAVEVGGPEVGLPEVFQMRDGMIYSEVMRGYLSCSGDGQESAIKGFVGEYLWQMDENYRLVFTQASEADIETARILRRLSKVVNDEQKREADEYLASQAELVTNSHAAGRDGEEEGVPTIAMCVPMTSRGTVIGSTDDSPVWTHAMSTFLSSTDWRAPKFRFHWYFGFDVGDPIYDGPQATKQLTRKFNASAVKEFVTQGLSRKKARLLLDDNILRLNTKFYEEMEHAPSYVVSALMQDAYADGCDYFYQINDDTLINTPGWAETFTRVLRTNPLGRNVGVTGPADTNNRRILTHAFVHRTHIDVFGRFFPLAFRNWWSDDWISNVYGREHTLRDHLVTITHDVKSYKSGANNRYEIEYGAQYELRKELRIGHVKLSKWLRANGMPPPSLPVVCGYSPLASDILKTLQEGWGGVAPLNHPSPPRASAKIPTGSEGGGGGGRGAAAAAAATDEVNAEASTNLVLNSGVAAGGAARLHFMEMLTDDADNP